jgi:hypothetical protein
LRFLASPPPALKMPVGAVPDSASGGADDDGRGCGGAGGEGNEA